MRLTGEGKRQTVGLLELLWHFAAEHAPRGDIGKWADQDISDAVNWDRSEDALIPMLIESGFVCTDEAHRLLIHDWPDHLMEMIRKRLQRANTPPLQCQCRQVASERRTVAAAVPTTSAHRTEPNRTEPNRTLKGVADSDSFACIWEQVNQSFKAYAPRSRGLVLNAHRKRRIAQLISDGEPQDPVRAVHGYAVMHLLKFATRHGGDWDPFRNFNPETVWRPSNVGKYLDAYNAAIDIGLSPPFQNDPNDHDRMQILFHKLVDL